MKKIFKKGGCLVLALVMLLLVVQPVNASTRKDTYKTSTLEAGTTVSGKQSLGTYNDDMSVVTYKHYIYKITVPEDGYITITNYKYADSRYIAVYKTLAAAKKDEYKTSYGLSYAKSMKVPLVAGTYYIRPASGEYKFKFAFKAATAGGTNYCMAKAKTVATGKTVTLCVPDQYQTYYWYKIKTTSKKTLSVTFKELTATSIPDSPRFTLYSAEGEELSVVHGDGYVYKSAKTLPAGTYYIRVNAYYRYNARDTYLFTLSWK